MRLILLAVVAACAMCAPAAYSQPAKPAAEAEVSDESHGRDLPEGSANLDFIIVNRTGRTITRVAISPAGEDSWSDNLLAAREVPPDERAAAAYTRDVELCSWDVRATFDSGAAQSWPAINLCETVRVELR